MIAELLDTRLNELKKTPPPSEATYVRSSGFGTLCPREEVLAAIHQIDRQELLEAKSLVNFALGTGMHSALQDIILPKAKLIRGEWACLSCSAHYGGPTEEELKANPMHFDPEQMILCPSACTKCGEHEFKYVEQFFRQEEFKITGHPDGFLEVPGMDGLGVLEAKSIGEKGAKEIKDAPKPEHFIQVQLYLWFTGLKWGNIFYWDKSKFNLDDAFTEHVVERDEDTIQQIKDTLSSLRQGLKFHILPNRICFTEKAPRAQRCACAKQCFSTENK